MNSPRCIVFAHSGTAIELIMALPLAGLIKERYPDIKVVWLGAESGREIISLSKNVDGFITQMEVIAQPKTLMAYKPEAIINLDSDPVVAAMGQDLGISLRIGAKSKAFNRFRCNYLIDLGTTLVRFHDTTIHLKYLQPFQVRGNRTLAELADYTRIAKRRNDSLRDIIIICPYGDDTREWDVSSIMELAKNLQSNAVSSGQAVTVLDCHGLYQNQFATLPKGANYVANLSFLEALDLVGKHGLVIGADSGLLQIASLQAKDVLVLFPPLSKYNITNKMPLGAHTKAISKDLRCSDCRQTAYCGCMATISPEEVQDAVCRQFSKYCGPQLKTSKLVPQT